MQCLALWGPVGIFKDRNFVVALEQLNKTGCFPEAFTFILGLAINVFVLKHPGVLILQNKISSIGLINRRSCKSYVKTGQSRGSQWQSSKEQGFVIYSFGTVVYFSHVRVTEKQKVTVLRTRQGFFIKELPLFNLLLPFLNW